MTKRLAVLFLLYFFVFTGIAQDLSDSTSVYRKLEYVMENQELYVKKKEDQIARLKKEAVMIQHDKNLYLNKNYEILKVTKNFNLIRLSIISCFAGNWL